MYNPQQLMRQFGYEKGAVVLTGKLSASSALVAEPRFVGHGVSQAMAGREKFF